MLDVKHEVNVLTREVRGKVVVAHLQRDVAPLPEFLLTDARDDERPVLREDTW